MSNDNAINLTVRPVGPKEIKAALGLAKKYNASPLTASYPLFKNEGQIKAEFEEAQKNGLLLGAFDGDRQDGALCLADCGDFLQSLGLFSPAEVYGDFLEYLSAIYPGREALFGFPQQNAGAAEFMGKRGKILERATVTLLKREKFKRQDNHSIRIDKDNFGRFAEFHDKNEPEIYWNSERLKESLDNWVIFTAEDGRGVCGSVAAYIGGGSRAEIFALTCDGENVAAELLSAAAEAFFNDKGGESVLFFVDDAQGRQLEAALKSDFEITGGYASYKIKL